MADWKEKMMVVQMADRMGVLKAVWREPISAVRKAELKVAHSVES
jgi:hypothetical protein